MCTCHLFLHPNLKTPFFLASCGNPVYFRFSVFFCDFVDFCGFLVILKILGSNGVQWGQDSGGTRRDTGGTPAGHRRDTSGTLAGHWRDTGGTPKIIQTHQNHQKNTKSTKSQKKHRKSTKNKIST
jgi:hypothetical protein